MQEFNSPKLGRQSSHQEEVLFPVELTHTKSNLTKFTQADIAYLYAVPLVRREGETDYSMGLPIDHQSEIQEIEKCLD